MRPEIIEYIRSQRTGVLAVSMPDGFVHGATVHFAHTEEPLVLYFLTERSSLKAQPVLQAKKCHASFVIGTDEINMKTFQLDGTLELVPPEHRQEWEEAYLKKYPSRAEWSKTEGAACLRFTPRWWRYSDMKHPNGRLVIASE